MKPQASVTLNLVSKDGSGSTAAAAFPFPPQQRREGSPPTEPAHLVLTKTPAWPFQAWLPTAQQGPFVIYLDEYWPSFLGTDMWEYVLLEDLGSGAGGPAYCLASLNAPVQSSWPSHFSPSKHPHLCWRWCFQAFNLYQNFKTWGDTKQNISVSFITL